MMKYQPAEHNVMIHNCTLTLDCMLDCTQGGHNPSALDFLADVANSAGNHVAGETSRGTAAAAVSAGMQPINGILKVHCFIVISELVSMTCEESPYRTLPVRIVCVLT